MGCLAEIVEKKMLYAFEDRPIIREFLSAKIQIFLRCCFDRLFVCSQVTLRVSQ